MGGGGQVVMQRAFILPKSGEGAGGAIYAPGIDAISLIYTFSIYLQTNYQSMYYIYFKLRVLKPSTYSYNKNCGRNFTITNFFWKFSNFDAV